MNRPRVNHRRIWEMSTVDVVDTVYAIYAAGLIVFMAFFAYKLTKPK